MYKLIEFAAGEILANCCLSHIAISIVGALPELYHLITRTNVFTRTNRQPHAHTHAENCMLTYAHAHTLAHARTHTLTHKHSCTHTHSPGFIEL
jgi:hypothetical protein